MKSDHANLLNALSDMSLSPHYALRRDILQQAEKLIYDQEQEIKRLKEAYEISSLG